MPFKAWDHPRPKYFRQTPLKSKLPSPKTPQTDILKFFRMALTPWSATNFFQKIIFFFFFFPLKFFFHLFKMFSSQNFFSWVFCWDFFPKLFLWCFWKSFCSTFSFNPFLSETKFFWINISCFLIQELLLTSLFLMTIKKIFLVTLLKSHSQHCLWTYQQINSLGIMRGNYR